MKKESYIKLRDIIEYCNKSAKTANDLANKCIESTGMGESLTSSLGGAAYFFEQKKIYEYEIPEMLKNLEIVVFGESSKPVELTPLEALDLSVRTYNILSGAGIKTLGDITKQYLFELENIRNLGRKSISEILEMLKRYRVSLKDDNVDHNEKTWISVDERLPECDKKYGEIDVLVCMDDGFVATAFYVDKIKDFVLWADAGEVTHWMPLPKSPVAQ